MDYSSVTDWKEASQSFDSAPNDYDIYRPGYPKELVDSLIELTNIPPDGKILEIGAGTGKATRPFAEHGFSILCIEPGANLAAIAARNLRAFPGVQFEIIRFEDWPETVGRFNLAFSAQAFHWVPKEIGYAKASNALKPHGHLALFWNMYPGFEGQLAAELDKIYREIAPELGSPLSEIDDAIEQRVGEIKSSGCFGSVTIKRFPWSMRYTTNQYLGLLNTYSDHIRLPGATRQHLSTAIGEAIEKHGGFINRPYEAVLYVAQKLPIL